MSSNRLYQHYRKQLALFREHFDNTNERLEVEDIHQLRVSIKKIRTNLTLMNIASEGKFKNKSHFKLLSKLFKNAGKLREIQVNQAILDKLNLEEQHSNELHQSAIHYYRNNLKQQSQKSIHQLKKTLNNFNFQKLKKHNHKLKKVLHN
jgi:CHAD domain-containing protein